jgi:ribosome biogenesis protein BMS1
MRVPSSNLACRLGYFCLLQFRPLVWRNTHPYVLVDRHEDITDPNEVDKNPDCDRSIVLYGYVRGTHLKPNMKVHLIGVGDYSMADVSALPDPCPIPEKDKEHKVRNNTVWRDSRLVCCVIYGCSHITSICFFRP